MANPRRSDNYDVRVWERVTTVVVAVLVIGLLCFLVIRNEPFADSNLVVVTRTILSLAVAILGATVPGFLNVSWRGTGLLIRAGGALALFVFTYSYTPTVLPALKDDGIPPLKNPRQISRLLNLLAPITLSAGQREMEVPTPLGVRVVYEGDGEPQRKRYDVVLSNAGKEQLLMTRFDVCFAYVKGQAESIESGKSLKPVEQYSLLLPIDTDRANVLLANDDVVYPPGPTTRKRCWAKSDVDSSRNPVHVPRSAFVSSKLRLGHPVRSKCPRRPGASRRRLVSKLATRCSVGLDWSLHGSAGQGRSYTRPLREFCRQTLRNAAQGQRASH
jgi:hypothetical protein